MRTVLRINMAQEDVNLKSQYQICVLMSSLKPHTIQVLPRKHIVAFF